MPEKVALRPTEASHDSYKVFESIAPPLSEAERVRYKELQLRHRELNKQKELEEEQKRAELIELRRTQLRRVLDTTTKPTIGPNPETITRQSMPSSVVTEAGRRESLQRDTEDLHAQLGRPGLRRLLHPFRNARIITTVFRRALKGEYNPNRAQASAVNKNGIPRNPFED